MPFFDKILKLSRQLYPTGRAFKMPMGGDLEKLHRAIADVESAMYADALSILDSTLPDNDNFTLEDAQAWYTRLGLHDNGSADLEAKKAAIIRKINHPGTIPARQHYLYLQGQLQAAGFDVYVHENRFSDGEGGYYTQTPDEVASITETLISEHSGELEHGMAEMGQTYQNICVNHIDEDRDSTFAISPNLRSTFFIGGETLGTFAEVDEDRKEEFRQLILKIKPVQTVAYLFTNYV